MSVRRDGNLIRLEGDCRVEDAETLVRLLQEDAVLTIDVSGCRSLHAAVAQVILSFGTGVTGAPADPFLLDHVLPNFTSELART
jgi:hypothetical protein